MAKTAYIINSRSRKPLKKFTKFRRLKGAEGEVFYTRHPGHAEQLARLAVQNGFAEIVAVGGDGTLHEVVNGIIAEAGEELQKTPTLSLIPAGSANDYARNFKKSSQEAVPVYLGKITLRSGETRYFVNISSIGLGATVAGNVNRHRSFLGAGFNFLREIVRSLISYKRPQVKLNIDDETWQGRLSLAAVANGKFFGNGLSLTPGADVSSPTFAVTVAGEVGLWDFLKNFTNIKNQRKLQHPQVQYFFGEKVLLRLLEGAAEIEADGEFIGTGDAEFSLLPNPIMFRIYR